MTLYETIQTTIGPNGMMYIAWAVYMIGQIADVATTRRALKVPGMYETNGFVRCIMEAFGKEWWVIKLFVSLVAAGLITYGQAPLVLLAMGMITIFVAIRNHRRTVAQEGKQ